MNEYNTWDYKVGDLIQVEKLGWPAEVGVVTAFRPQGEAVPRNYWEWVSAETGRTMFFHEIKAKMLAQDHKVKLLARGEA
jgi:hypothetical protein